MEEAKSSIHDDEFQFTDAEIKEAHPYEDAVATKNDTSKNLTRRRILIALGIIVVALSLYKLLGVFFGGREIPKKRMPSQTSPLLNEIKTTPQTAQKSVTPVESISAPAFTTQSQSEPKISHEVSNDEITKINTDLNKLTANVNQLQSSITDVKQKLAAITTQLQHQQTSIEKLEPVMTTKKIRTYRVPPGRPKPRLVDWHVTALIPGRAWLVRPDGATVTVKVGDALPGYGIIRNISVIKGFVSTTSGVIIRSRGM